jgi:TolA-binding protein
MKLLVLIVLFLLALAALAQAPAPPKPQPSTLPDNVALKIRTAQHTIDATEGKIKDLQIQWADLQTKMKDLQPQYQQLQTEDTAEKTSLNAAIDEAYKSAGKDKASWDFNPETLAFTAKPTPPAPQPVKDK